MIGEVDIYKAFLVARAVEEQLLVAHARFPYAPITSKYRLADAEQHLKELAGILGYDLVSRVPSVKAAERNGYLPVTSKADTDGLNCDAAGNVVGTR